MPEYKPLIRLSLLEHGLYPAFMLTPRDMEMEDIDITMTLLDLKNFLLWRAIRTYLIAGVLAGGGALAFLLIKYFS